MFEREIGLALMVDLFAEGMGKQGLRLFAMERDLAQARARVAELEAAEKARLAAPPFPPPSPRRRRQPSAVSTGGGVQDQTRGAGNSLKIIKRDAVVEPLR